MATIRFTQKFSVISLQLPEICINHHTQHWQKTLFADCEQWMIIMIVNFCDRCSLPGNIEGCSNNSTVYLNEPGVKRCSRKSWLAMTMFCIYILTTSIMLINLLIAIFRLCKATCHIFYVSHNNAWLSDDDRCVSRYCQGLSERNYCALSILNSYSVLVYYSYIC